MARDTEKLITDRDYWKEVQNIKKEALREYKDWGRDTDPNEWLSDWLHQTIDGHQWIIYTWYNTQVLTHSRNDDAYFENYGPLEADGFSDAVQKMAFAAFYEDVMQDIDIEPFEKLYNG